MCNTNSRRGGGCLHSLFHFTPTLNLDFPSPPVENTSLNLLSSIGDHQTSRSTNYWELLEIMPNHIDLAVTIYLSVSITNKTKAKFLLSELNEMMKWCRNFVYIQPRHLHSWLVITPIPEVIWFLSQKIAWNLQHRCSHFYFTKVQSLPWKKCRMKHQQICRPNY